MTSNISHSITTSTNGGPQYWYNTTSFPQLEIHSHTISSMRIIDLIQHKSRIDTIEFHSIDRTQDQSWYYSQYLQYNITTSIIWGYLGLDTTKCLDLIPHKSWRMTPNVVQSTLHLREGGILLFTRNFLPYQDYLRSISTSSLTTDCPQVWNILISSYVLKYFLYRTMTSMK